MTRHPSKLGDMEVSEFRAEARRVADRVADYLERHPKMLGEGTHSKFLTTGDSKRVSDRATQFLRRRIEFEAA